MGNAAFRECNVAASAAAASIRRMQTAVHATHAPSTGAEEQYFAGLARYQFRIQWCDRCRHALFFPRQFCPDCMHEPLEWIEPAGTGTVYATTTVRLKPGEPYNVSVIELDEGVRMMSRVESVDPGAVRIGMRVRLRLAPQDKGPALVVFDPLEG